MPVVAHTPLTAPDAKPAGWMVFLHGILGSRSNWRSIARRLVQARPEGGALLVDLREHGESKGFEPPHTVAAAAADLDALPARVDAPVRGVLGHSFGGKVALQWALRQAAPLEQVWLIDSNPGPRPDARGSETTLQVVEMLEQLELPVASREQFVGQVRERGHDETLAQWLAMNLQRRGDGRYELGLDLGAIRALLDDYFQRDLWPVVEEPPPGVRLHLVIGERSTVLDARDRDRARAAAEKSDRVHVHVVERAGHWVHMEAAERLLSLLTEARSP